MPNSSSAFVSLKPWDTDLLQDWDCYYQWLLLLCPLQILAPFVGVCYYVSPASAGSFAFPHQSQIAHETCRWQGHKQGSMNSLPNTVIVWNMKMAGMRNRRNRNRLKSLYKEIFYLEARRLCSSLRDEVKFLKIMVAHCHFYHDEPWYTQESEAIIHQIHK